MNISASKRVEARQKPPRDVIVCTRRKNRPQVFVAVCWQCRYGKKCKDFARYVQPSLFGDPPAVLGQERIGRNKSRSRERSMNP